MKVLNMKKSFLPEFLKQHSEGLKNSALLVLTELQESGGPSSLAQGWPACMQTWALQRQQTPLLRPHTVPRLTLPEALSRDAYTEKAYILIYVKQRIHFAFVFLNFPRS